VVAVARFGFGTGADTVPVACLSSDAVGDVLAMRDTATLTGRWRMQRADPADSTKMPGIGILLKKVTPTTGIMQRSGQVRGVYAGMSFALACWVGTDGRPTTVIPAPGDGDTVILQRFGIPVAGDVLFLTGEVGPLTKRLG
jgi:hypothetical protein